MSLNILYNSKALGFGVSAPFEATGGTAPYVYSVVPEGVGGSISSSGVYTAPFKLGNDTIRVTDATGRTAVLKVFVGTALHLFCDILQHQLGLPDGRVYLWDQKINMPTDEGLFIAVETLFCKPFGVTNRFDSVTNQDVQSVNMLANVTMDLISRGPDARDRKEEVLMALSSDYAEKQMELNSFYIGRITSNFTNLSQVDGSAIPYRFNLNVNLQYEVMKKTGIGYYNNFQNADVTTDF
jgi:hypothetical protein